MAVALKMTIVLKMIKPVGTVDVAVTTSPALYSAPGCGRAPSDASLNTRAWPRQHC
jgi:hypothetical protein